MTGVVWIKKVEMKIDVMSVPVPLPPPEGTWVSPAVLC